MLPLSLQYGFSFVMGRDWNDFPELEKRCQTSIR